MWLLLYYIIMSLYYYYILFYYYYYIIIILYYHTIIILVLFYFISLSYYYKRFLLMALLLTDQQLLIGEWYIFFHISKTLSLHLWIYSYFIIQSLQIKLEKFMSKFYFPDIIQLWFDRSSFFNADKQNLLYEEIIILHIFILERNNDGIHWCNDLELMSEINKIFMSSKIWYDHFVQTSSSLEQK